MALLGTFQPLDICTIVLRHTAIGEMHFVPTRSSSTFNLPRAGGVSFCVQESWVQNETIRENILFNTPYDEERYKKG